MGRLDNKVAIVTGISHNRLLSDMQDANICL